MLSSNWLLPGYHKTGTNLQPTDSGEPQLSLQSVLLSFRLYSTPSKCPIASPVQIWERERLRNYFQQCPFNGPLLFCYFHLCNIPKIWPQHGSGNRALWTWVICLVSKIVQSRTIQRGITTLHNIPAQVLTPQSYIHVCRYNTCECIIALSFMLFLVIKIMLLFAIVYHLIQYKQQ